MIDRRHLETLCALRDHGSLAAAAGHLHITPSALSHQLAALEERLGCALFLRKSQPLRFTAAGQRLLDLAQDVLPRLREAERDVLRLAGLGSGRLHLAIECHSCYRWLMPTVDRFRHDWPEVEMDLSAGFHFEALAALVRGELDLVITGDPQSLPGVTYLPLFRHEVVVAVAADHPLIRKAYIEPADLAGETVVTYPVDRERLDIFRHFLDPAGIVPVGVRTAALTVMILQLVASHRGVAMLPHWALAEAPAGEVIGIRVGRQGKFGVLYAAMTTEGSQIPYMQAFVQAAREVSFATLTGITSVG